MAKRLKACVSEPKRFENPRSMGERSMRRDREMSFSSASGFIPLKRMPATVGIRKYAATDTVTIKMQKKEKILSMNSRRDFRLCPSFSMMKGTSTESETTEATVTKMKSGMRKAA